MLYTNIVSIITISMLIIRVQTKCGILQKEVFILHADMADDLGLMLLDSSRRLKWNMTSRLMDVGLTFPQWMVIYDISGRNATVTDGSDCTPATISGRLNVDRPTISGIIERLEKNGWVFRSVHPEDRRSCIINLTAKAQELVSELEQQRQLAVEQAIQGFSKEEILQLKQYLGRIIDNLKL